MHARTLAALSCLSLACGSAATEERSDAGLAHDATSNVSLDGDVEGDVVHVTFPPSPRSFTSGARMHLVVHAVDASSVRIGGTDAVLSGEAWRAELSLEEGENAIEVLATTREGEVARAVHVAHRGVAPWHEPVDVAVEGGRALVLDAVAETLWSVELSSGARSVLSNAHSVSPDHRDDWDLPSAMAVDAARGRVLVTDAIARAVIAVDLATGARSVLSDEAHGSGALLERPLDAALDERGNRLLVVEGGRSRRVTAVDLDGGDRTTWAVTPSLNAPRAVLVTHLGKLFVLDEAAGVVEVDRSGAQMGISSVPAGVIALAERDENSLWLLAEDGAVLVLDPSEGADSLHAAGGGATARALAPSTDGLLVVTSTPADLREVVDGTARSVVDPTTPRWAGDGPSLRGSRAVAWDPTRELVYAWVDGGDVVRASLATGVRESVARGDLAPALAVDEVTGELFLVEGGTLVSVDGASRVQLASGLVDVVAITVDASHAYVAVEGGDEVWRVSRASGEVLPLVASGDGLGPDVLVSGLAADRRGNRLVITDESRDRLLAVTLDDGARFVVLATDSTHGDRIGSMRGVAVVDEGYLVLDPGLSRLFFVDRTTGVASRVSDDERGDGPTLLGSDLFAAAGTTALFVDPYLGTWIAVDVSSGHRVLTAW